MSIASTAQLNAEWIVQRGVCVAHYTPYKPGEPDWDWYNYEFFDTKEQAELYVIQMKPFWTSTERDRVRVIHESEL